MKGITITNQPKVTGHEVDKDRDARVVSLAPEVEEFVSNNELFKGKEVKITFSDQGVSSLVSIIEAPEGKFVLKIPLSTHPLQGEADFLEVWRAAGIKVPVVRETGTLNDRPYLLMDFVDAKILTKAYRPEELLERKVFEEMGQTLAKMHGPKAVGYGRVVNGHAEYWQFEDWLPKMDDSKLTYVKKNNLLNDVEHGSLSKAMQILAQLIEDDGQSVYCHNDFTPANIFATSPLTVFDPDPIFNHPYLDLSRSIVMSISLTDLLESGNQLMNGYFLENPGPDRQALQAAIILNSHMKFAYWHKTDQGKRISRIQSYLQQTKHRLEK